jgi:lipopolysaccharide transport system ATP-binding protein
MTSAGKPVVAQVDQVSKKFARALRRSMTYGLVDLGRNLVGRPSPTEVLRKGEFWAVDDVSLELRMSQSIGIIGVNGSGKSTLLRVIAGILPPDRGQVTIRGRLAAMIEVGAGFHPHLSGRENVFINASLLGLSRSDIRDRMDDIVSFAELGDFIDSPVAMYSTGMRGRLGFAVSTALEPDVLLLDEVFATGDLAFRQRCFERLDELSGSTAMILVSHLPTHVRRVCDRVIWLENGQVRLDGDTDTVLAAYAEEMKRIDRDFADRTGRARAADVELEVM